MNRTQRRKPPKSINRLQYREIGGKITPAIKILSKHMYSTTPEAPKDVFFGYKVPAGEFSGGNGIQWQIQILATCIKGDFIKENEIKPIINKWALLFKFRLFIKTLVDKIFAE